MARAQALEMILCSRTIASANACVANAMVAIAVSGINQESVAHSPLLLFGSRAAQHFATDGGLRLDEPAPNEWRRKSNPFRGHRQSM
jgi:hypothetical protein